MPDKTILVSGYFSNIAQSDKLEFFERLDAALQPKGVRIVLLSQTSEKLNTTCAYERVPRYILRAERLRLGMFSGGRSDDASRHAASILAERDQLSLSHCFVKVKLFQRFVIRALRKWKPIAMLAWHEFNVYHYSISALLQTHNIPALFIEYGVLPGTVNLDDRGQMAKSWFARLPHDSKSLFIDAEDLKRTFEMLKVLRETPWLRRPGDPREALSERFELEKESGHPIIFYAGQNDYASGMLPATLPDAKLHSPFFEDTRDALLELSHLARRQNWIVLFKPHPMDKRDWREVFDEFNDVLRMEKDADIHACIEKSDVTVTILSQVSYLAPMAGKGCVLLGRNHMAGKGCAYEIGGREETETAILSALNREDYQTHARLWEKHVAQLIRHYLFPYTHEAQSFFDDTDSDLAEMILSFANGQDVPKFSGPEPSLDRTAVPYGDPGVRIAILNLLLHAFEPYLWLVEKSHSIASRLAGR